MKASLRNILLFVISVSSVSAQTVLTLDQCLVLAREHNKQLRIAENDVQTAALSRNELLTTRYPQVQFEGSAIYAPSSGHFGYDPVISNSGQFSAQAVVRQSLYDGGIRNMRADQIGVDIELHNRQFRLTERDIVFEVKQAYTETLRSREEIGLQTESVSQLSEYLARVKQLSGGGNASYTDILKTQVQLSSAELSRDKALESYATAKYTLAELIGGAIDTAFEVTGSLDAMRDESIDSLLATEPDSVHSIELSIAALAIQRSQLDIELTKHELWPTISMIGDAGLLTSRDNLQLPYSERAGIFGYSLGVLVEVPLSNWGATDLRVEQRQRAMSDLQFQSDLMQRSLNGEAKKTRLRLLNVRNRLDVLRKNRKFAEENFLLTKSKYIGGGALSLEVLSAQQLLTDTRLSELQALADIQSLSSRLEQLLTP